MSAGAAAPLKATRRASRWPRRNKSKQRRAVVIGIDPDEMFSPDGRYLVEKVLPEEGIELTIRVDVDAEG